MSAPCGPSLTASFGRSQSPEGLEAAARPEGFDRVFFPDCCTPLPSDEGLYPYQRVSRDLLRSPGGKNLLVASPTGSGKTRIIEECVAIARERGQRVFVAEPLIALVEQIYTRIGGEGIRMLTGPSRKGQEDADVTVCTYEVLARIAACEPELLDGCPCIVIDEFHFLGTDRGPVIEEILAHCQQGRSVVALSGTMPNVVDLAAFLSRLNGFPTYVVGASRRPIDISFYTYAAAEDRMSVLQPPSLARQPPAFRSQAIGGVTDRQCLLRFLAQLDRWDCNPSLLVSFSCRKLDELADWAASVSSIDRTARRHVAVGFAKLFKSVAPEDRCLFALYKHWADSGVAVHHSHAPVPYLELVSWLAERRALKLVFSSSTLSAGINLPVRTMCLLSARVPRQAPDGGGGIAHVDIDPLLFHQLVGRAGRPGYETVGNCIILTKRQCDYSSAQALMTCLVPPVLPQSGFAAGDVLRAARDGRCLVAEVQALACPVEHALALRASRDELLLRTALARFPEANRAIHRLQARAAHEVFEAPPALLPFACLPPPGLPDAPPMSLVLWVDGGFGVLSTLSLSGVVGVARAVPLTLAKKVPPKKVPFEEVGRVIRLQEAFRILLKFDGDASEELRALRRICFLQEGTARELASSPLREDFERAARALENAGCLQKEECAAPGESPARTLTPLGAAAAELRTCQEPQEALRRLLKCGELSPEQALAFASQILQEGRGRGEDAAIEAEGALPWHLRAAEEVLASEALASALQGFEGSSRHWTLAVLCWASGALLSDLRQLVAVGSFCRHVTRVADFCDEAATGLKALGVDPGPFVAANASVSRGMPFLKRGVWKACLAAEVGGGEAAPEEASLAASLDFGAIFGASDVEEEEEQAQREFCERGATPT